MLLSGKAPLDSIPVPPQKNLKYNIIHEKHFQYNNEDLSGFFTISPQDEHSPKKESILVIYIKTKHSDQFNWKEPSLSGELSENHHLQLLISVICLFLATLLLKLKREN